MAETTTGTTSSGPSGGESSTNTSTTTTGGGTTTGDVGGGIGKPDGTVAPAPATENGSGESNEKEHAALQAAIGAHDRSILGFLEETATKVELIFEDDFHKAKEELMAAWQKLKAAIKPVVSDDYSDEAVDPDA